MSITLSLLWPFERTANKSFRRQLARPWKLHMTMFVTWGDVLCCHKRKVLEIRFVFSIFLFPNVSTAWRRNYYYYKLFTIHRDGSLNGNRTTAEEFSARISFRNFSAANRANENADWSIDSALTDNWRKIASDNRSNRSALVTQKSTKLYISSVHVLNLISINQLKRAEQHLTPSICVIRNFCFPSPRTKIVFNVDLR